MENGFKFKVRGFDTLMTIDDLLRNEKALSRRFIKVIDTKSKKTWTTDYRTIKSKFG